ncbi:MAG: TetR/AcrR family transcriptional regulator [Kangiellaceae bacterium]|nr:TetR/AcrR family transcriptional regulator [Kangiellaceae bacterium]
MAIIDRKQREFERREEDILDAALLLFSQPNWESVSIEKVAKQAQIGKGTVYKHFESKDELLFKLMLRFYQGMLVTLPLKQTQSLPAVESFKTIFELVLQYHIENREYRYVVEYCGRIDFKARAKKSWRDAFKAIDQSFGEFSDPKLLEAMEKGEIAKRPIEEIHVGLAACFEGAVNMLWASTDWCSVGTDEEIVERIINFMVAGLIGQPK